MTTTIGTASFDARRPGRIFAAALLALAVALPGAGHADDFNKRPHLDPGSRSKVNRVMARAWRDGQAARDTKPDEGKMGCGNQVIGDFGNGRNAPREVIIVARDVINVSRGC